MDHLRLRVQDSLTNVEKPCLKKNKIKITDTDSKHPVLPTGASWWDISPEIWAHYGLNIIINIPDDATVNVIEEQRAQIQN